jgi:hypothetical protein
MMKDYVCSSVISNFIILDLIGKLRLLQLGKKYSLRFITIYEIPAVNSCPEPIESKLHSDLQIFCSALCF